jgi:hypothetical protein
MSEKASQKVKKDLEALYYEAVTELRQAEKELERTRKALSSCVAEIEKEHGNLILMDGAEYHVCHRGDTVFLKSKSKSRT